MDDNKDVDTSKGRMTVERCKSTLFPSSCLLLVLTKISVTLNGFVTDYYRGRQVSREHQRLVREV